MEGIKIGFDYASARPDLDALRAAGVFVARYVCTVVGTKTITKKEADDIRAHGLGLVLVYEQYEKRPLEGRVAGSQDAIVALAQSIAAGFPKDRPIYFAVDFDARPADQPAIDEYLRGAAEILGLARVGVYGGINLIDRCFASGTAKWFWQTGAWSYHKESVHANFVQMTVLNGTIVGGVKVDINETRKEDWGAAFMPIVTVPTKAELKLIELKIMDVGHNPKDVISWGAMEWTIYRLLQALGKA
jgi:hypothetical protein